MIDLTGKSVLFISPVFFGYEKAIKTRLEEIGAYVDYFDERPGNSFWKKGFIRLNRRFLTREITLHYQSIICSVSGKSYDYVFVINIEAMPAFFLHYIKKRLPGARMILYMWDSMRNKKNALNYFPFFDMIFSFDENDCRNFPVIKFRPLFFLNEYKEIGGENSFEYDFSFVGTAHSDRYALIRKIQCQLEEKNFKSYWYLFLQSRKLFFFQKIYNAAFREARMQDFNYKALPKDKLIDIIRKSRIILDIQHPNQSGLTMRTIEMLGANRKLVTTNPSVRDYEFYTSRNILIIDRNNPVIPEDFCTGEYQPVDKAIYYKYSLDGWLDDIFRTVQLEEGRGL